MRRRFLSLALAAGLLLAACEASEIPAAAAPAPVRLDDATSQRLDDALAVLSADTIGGQWARSCALCHANGNGGAPLVGDEADWRPRVAAGENALLAHTLEGYGAMPPLGYCMDCTEADFRALIRFMLPAARRQQGQAQ